MSDYQGLPDKHGLYNPELEKDSCGVGFIANVKGKPSHQIVLDADMILRNMDHRGGCGCEPNTGDGAGILTALPHKFLQKVAKRDLGVTLPAAGKFAAGIVFLPRDSSERAYCKEQLERLIVECGQKVVGWRKVPTQPDVADIGPSARRGEPWIEQIFVEAADGLEGDAFERRLYLARKQASHLLRGDKNLKQRLMFYVCSLSTKVMIYKGMLRPMQILPYYPDLTDPDFETHLAMVHSRF
jgi:glutamate synthase (NADPH/NADH) large chain